MHDIIPQPRLLQQDWHGPGEMVCRVLGLKPCELRFLSATPRSHVQEGNGSYAVGKMAAIAYYLRNYRTSNQSVPNAIKECLRISSRPKKDPAYQATSSFVNAALSEALREMLGPDGDDIWRMFPSLDRHVRSASPVVLESDIPAGWSDIVGMDPNRPFPDTPSLFGYTARNVCLPGWQRYADDCFDGEAPVRREE